MATVLGSLLLKLTGDTADARQAIDQVEKKAKGFSKFIKGAMGIGGAVIAFRALKNISKELIAVYSVQETAEAKLRSAITATGKEGLISAQALYEYASQLQEVTTYGDEATISAMALLQQLGDLSEEGIKQLMPLIQDFASSGLVNLETAVSLVGKTLGSTTNALSRYGIVIDATAPKEEKLAQLTEAMQKKFGGLSQDLAKTGTGALQQYQNAMGDLKEVMGETVLRGIEPFVRGMTNVISDLVKSKQEAILTKRAYEELKNLGEGQVLAEDQQLRILKDQVNFLGQVAVSYEMLDEKANAAYEAAKERLQAYKDAIIAEKYWNDQAARAASEAAKREAEEEAEKARKTKEMLAWQQMVNDKYAETEEAQKAILDAEIEKWEYELTKSNVYKPKIEAILEMLYEQRDAEKETGEAAIEAINEEVDAAMAAYQFRVDAEQAYQEELAAIRERAREQEKLAAEKLAEDKRLLEQATLDFITQIWGALDSLSSARASRELALLRKRHEAELEGFTGTEEEKQALLEKFEKERAKLEYEAAMKSWRLQLAGGLAAAARAILEAAKNAWPIPALPMMALAGIMGGVQVAAIHAAKPIPAFAEGADFIVPPGYPNDSYIFRAESGEHVEVTPPGREEGFFVAAPLYLNIDSKPIYQGLLRASKAGIALINEKAVTTR